MGLSQPVCGIVAPSSEPDETEIGLFGGRPVFDEQFVVGRPNIPDRAAFLSRIESMLDSVRLTNLGPMSVEFERRVAGIGGAGYGISVCNATIGLELAISALGLEGEVIVPSFTFIATAHALWRQGIRPVFCDVDPETHTLDPAAMRRAITPATTGILGVSLWGNYAGERALREIADAHNIKFLLDSAHSFGCSREDGGPPLCDAEVFSFHATKCIQSIEGGVITTNDPDLAQNLRLMVNFGFSGEDRVTHLGTNAKMGEASAAMGLASLERQDGIFAQNRLNHDAYRRGLSRCPGLRVLLPSGERHNFQYLVVEVDAETAGLSRDELVGALRLENVQARRYFHPGCHRMMPYARLVPEAGLRLPVTEALAARVMVLPTGMSVTTSDIDRLTIRIAAILARAPDVRTAIATCRDSRLPEFLRDPILAA